MSYHLTPVRVAIVNKVTSAGKHVEKREALCTVGRNVTWGGHYGKQYGGS